MDEEAQTVACTQLLANVVSLAVLDACLKPVKRKGPERHKVEVAQDKAIDAMMFLMEGAQHFVELLGMEGDRFKKQLLKSMYDNSQTYFTNTITAEQRRNFRFNLYFWQNNPARRRFLPEDDDENS
jgi:hypothetical protein